MGPSSCMFKRTAKDFAAKGSHSAHEILSIAGPREASDDGPADGPPYFLLSVRIFAGGGLWAKPC